MYIEILGSAAGGGFPQWNCNCVNCRSLRAGTFAGKPRTQTQFAISDDGEHWLLLNASPDLRLQIETTPALHPRRVQRTSPICTVLLTGADLDQTAGLLSLRELQPFRIYCTSSLRRVLREQNNVFGMLNRIPRQVDWKTIKPAQSFAVADNSGENLGLCCEVFSLRNRYPVYVSEEQRAGLVPEEASLGLIVQSSSGKRVTCLPAVSTIDEALRGRMESSDVLFFDGTFWSDDELIRVLGSGATARDMGHVPVSGPDGSLESLAGVKRPRKIYIHVNNTNPMLNEAGPEYAEVRAQGWEIAEDGWRLEL